MAEYIEPKSPVEVLKFFWKTFFGEENLWDNARFILADVPVVKEEAERILPPGMKLDDPAEATLFIVDYRKNSFTEPYKEAAVLIHVRTPLGRGVHCPWMIVNDDTAMIYGRELLGFPKKMGELTFEENGDHIKASVARRGVTVMEIEGTRRESQTPAPPVLGRKIFNSGGPGQFFLLNPVWLFHPTEVIHESYSVDVKVTLRESEHDPIARFLSSEATSGRFAVIDIPSGKYHIPIGLAGLNFFRKTFPMRFR